jgi:type III secretion protein J
MKRIALIALFLASGCKQAVQHGLDEAQANEIETLLHEAGIDAKKSRESGRDARWSVEVPDESAALSLKLLTDHGFPREKAPGFGEIFGKGSMVPTTVEENALFLHALSGEISRTLNGLDGIVSARVHVVASPAGPPSALRAPVKPRASVLLKVKSGRIVEIALRKPEIQALVAGSVEGLDADKVSVMLSELPVPPAMPPSPVSRSFKVPLFFAASLVALLSGALAFAFLYVRRLQKQMAVAPLEPDAAAITPVR